MRICPQCGERTLKRLCEHDGFQTVDEALNRESDDPRVGCVFEERYRIDGVLGRGGMGTVYRATQLSVGRPVALKVLNVDLVQDLTTIARFQQEARSVAALRHPNTIRLIDFGQAADGTLFLVMEFLEGEPLSALIKREGPLEPERVIRIGVQVLESLAEAHSVGIIHRDLKPDNLFLTELFGRPDFVKVLDFGIAKTTGFGQGSNLTGDGVALGTPRYIAPEQASATTIDGRADIYALSAVLFEMLSGKPPFLRASVVEYILAHIEAEVPPITVQGEVLFGPLPDLIRQGLSKLPLDRPASASLALERLRACAGRPYGSPETSELLARSERGANVKRASTASRGGRDFTSSATTIDRRPVRHEAETQAPSLVGPMGDSRPHLRASETGLSQRGREPFAQQRALHRSKRVGGLALAALLFLGLGMAGASWYIKASSSEAAVERVVAFEPMEEAAPKEPTAANTLVGAKAEESSERAALRSESESNDDVLVLTTVPAGASVKRGAVELGVTPLAIVWATDGDRRGLVITLEGYERERLRRTDVGASGRYELYLRPKSSPSSRAKAKRMKARSEKARARDGWIDTISKERGEKGEKKRGKSPKSSDKKRSDLPVYQELD